MPEWFVKLFTKEYDVVLDPFMGSGTTLLVAQRMKRHSIGIDVVPEYYKMVKKQLKPTELYLLEPEVKYGKKTSRPIKYKKGKTNEENPTKSCCIEVTSLMF